MKNACFAAATATAALLAALAAACGGGGGSGSGAATAPTAPPMPSAPSSTDADAGAGAGATNGGPAAQAPRSCGEGNGADCVGKCDAGDRNACFILADAYGDGKGGVARDLTKAGAILEKTCLMKASDHETPLPKEAPVDATIACMVAGDMLLTGKDGVPKDVAKGVAAWQAGCDEGHQMTCAVLFTELITGKKLPKDAKRALAMQDKVCGKVPQWPACVKLGWMLEHGDGLPKDAKRGKAMQDRACAGAAKDKCNELRAMADVPPLK